MNVDLSQVFAELGLPFLSLLLLLCVALLFSAYLKVMTVLGIVRLGLGGTTLPSIFVTGAIALSLTLFVMFPVLQRSAQSASVVLKQSDGTKTEEIRYRAIDAASTEWLGFLKKHADEKLVTRFSEIAVKLDAGKLDAGKSGSAVSGTEAVKAPGSGEGWRILAPAFVITQMKEAFSIGLSILLPFLLIDLIVVTVLGAMGLERMEPGYVALPAKLLLFTLVDGWTLITTNLVLTYQ